MEIPAEIVADILEHHGVKGMHWGVRKQFNTSVATPSSSSKVKGSEHFSKEQAASMNNIAKKMNKAYGFKVDEFVPLTAREEGQYLGYVKGKGSGSNDIHVSTNPGLKDVLVECQKAGWFAQANHDKVIEACLTHEASHGMFHQVNPGDAGIIGTLRTQAPIEPMRKSAWDAAKAQGVKDGDIAPNTGFRRITGLPLDRQISKKTSRYAGSSLFIEESEAEMFTAYHWSDNPPKFVDAFMTDIHTSMGKSVQPFSGRKVSNAS
jgi:hypothetical protein